MSKNSGHDDISRHQLSRPPDREKLDKLCVVYTKWAVLYRDSETRKFWKMTFPQSKLQGGGPPHFEEIDREQARKEFGTIATNSEKFLQEPKLAKERYGKK